MLEDKSEPYDSKWPSLDDLNKEQLMEEVLRLQKKLENSDKQQNTPQGWVKFYNAKKRHYCIGLHVLCGRWVLYRLPEADRYQQVDNDDPGNCAECRQRLKKTGWRFAIPKAL